MRPRWFSLYIGFSFCIRHHFALYGGFHFAFHISHSALCIRFSFCNSFCFSQMRKRNVISAFLPLLKFACFGREISALHFAYNHCCKVTFQYRLSIASVTDVIELLMHNSGGKYCRDMESRSSILASTSVSRQNLPEYDDRR